MLAQGPCHHLEESVAIKNDNTCTWCTNIRMFQYGFGFNLSGWHVQRDLEKVPEDFIRPRLRRYRERVEIQDQEDNAKRRARNEKH